MTEPAISVRSLSKCYRLGSINRHTLVEEFEHWWHKLRGRDPRQHMSRIGHSPTEARRVEDERKGAALFWALREVSLDVRPGEVVGIIGRNGAGKSTLLKILSRITEPTEGEAIINGRVGSLLEVGTGFHPELTGRENIFMNGAILGMKRAEIAGKFDAIVEFAELEEFIDTPVKRYSSGMYVRLAFAVAAHLDPEILVVDEVLAVGDAEFQKRCLGRIREVAETGRTVLFVSHQMNTIRLLCSRCILMHNGQVAMDGAPADIVASYESGSYLQAASEGLATTGRQMHGQVAHFSSWRVMGGDEPYCLSVSGPLRFEARLHVAVELRKAVHGIAIRNADRQLIWAWAAYNLHLKAGDQKFEYDLSTFPVKPGEYTLQFSLYDEVERVDLWDAMPPLIIKTAPLTHPRDEWSGLLNIPCNFTHEG